MNVSCSAEAAGGHVGLQGLLCAAHLSLSHAANSMVDPIYFWYGFCATYTFAMCTLTISSTNVYRIGDTLRVAGTAQGCTRGPDGETGLRVDFDCGGALSQTFPATDDAGNWIAQVPAGACDCPPQGEAPRIVIVTVTCLFPADAEPCLPVSASLPMRCVDKCIELSSVDDSGEDIITTDVNWFCAPEPGPDAIVTLGFWVANDLTFAAEVRLQASAMISIVPDPPPVVPAGAVVRIEFAVRVPTPLLSPGDLFFITFNDPAGGVIPCPGPVFQQAIEISCCPVIEAPRILVSSAGCVVRLTWDNDQIPDGCRLQFNFADPANSSLQFSDPDKDFKEYSYSQNGTYGPLTVSVVCEDGCDSAPTILDPVTITGCTPGDTPPVVPPAGEPPKEDLLCGALRVLAVVSSALVLFLLALAWCLSSLPLVKAAGWLALVSAVLWVLYWLFSCDKPCGVAKLSAAEALIAAGLAYLTYSACCTWQFLLLGFAFLALGLYLFYQWRDDCGYSECYAWAELAKLGTAVTTYLIFILDLVPGVSACKAVIVTLAGVDITGSKLVAFITAFTVLKVVACIQGKAPDNSVVTDE